MIALYILGGLIVLILLVAAVVGTKWSFEKSVQINAPVDKVWSNTNSLHAINTWNPWLDRDPNLTQQYTGTDGTPGASYAWDSPQKNVGAGNQTIVSVKDRSEFNTQITFIRPFAGKADAWVYLTTAGNSVTVTWGIASSTPYPMNIIKLFGVIQKNMDRDFTKGLGLLKSLCEK